jgi:hypothetical protein
MPAHPPRLWPALTPPRWPEISPPLTRDAIPRFIAILISLYNAVGWYSGVAFHDSMHFEVSEERIILLSHELKLQIRCA